MNRKKDRVEICCAEPGFDKDIEDIGGHRDILSPF